MRRDVKTKPRLCALVPIWRRHALASLCIGRLKGQVEEVVVVGSEEEHSEAVAAKHDAIYIEAPNDPLGAKMNIGLHRCRRTGCDAVVVIGSDNFVTDSLFDAWREQIADGVEYVGVLDGYVYDPGYSRSGPHLARWPGYAGARAGEPLGSGRCYSKALLDRMGWRLWLRGLNSGLDKSATQQIKRAAPHAKTFTMGELGIAHLGVKGAVSISGFPQSAVPCDVAQIDELFGKGFAKSAARAVTEDSYGVSNPDGAAELEKPAEWYDEAYRCNPKNYMGPARDIPFSELVWRPALRLSFGRVLDVGCGMGHLGEIAAEMGCNYVRGVDYSEVAIEAARARCPGVEFVVQDAIDAMAAGDYDTVVMLELLEHVYRDMEIVCAVPSGKRVTLSVPNFRTEGHCRWFESWDQAADRYGDAIRIDAGFTRRVGANAWFLISGIRR